MQKISIHSKCKNIEHNSIPALPFSRLTKAVARPKSKGYPHNPRTIGEHIRKKRMDEEMIQEEIAKLLGTSVDTITGWENNRSQPQIRLYPKIITFLGYNPVSQTGTTLGGKIREYRLRNGLSNKKMGEVLGVDGSTILSWENNEHLPQSGFIKMIMKILHSDC